MTTVFPPTTVSPLLLPASAPTLKTQMDLVLSVAQARGAMTDVERSDVEIHVLRPNKLSGAFLQEMKDGERSIFFGDDVRSVIADSARRQLVRRLCPVFDQRVAELAEELCQQESPAEMVFRDHGFAAIHNEYDVLRAFGWYASYGLVSENVEQRLLDSAIAMFPSRASKSSNAEVLRPAPFPQ